MKKGGLIPLVAVLMFSIASAKTALIVNDSSSPDVSSNEIYKIMKSYYPDNVEMVGADEIENGTVDLSKYDTLVCLIYGGEDSVSNFSQKVLSKLKAAIENGATFFTNTGACAGKVLSFLGIYEGGEQSCWCPALPDSQFILNFDEGEPLFEGVATYNGSPFEHDVYYWDNNDFDFLLWRVDNSRSYTGRYGVIKQLIKPTKYLAEKFYTGWEVNEGKGFPEWDIGKGRIIMTTAGFWTFDQDTGKGGKFGKAGLQILRNLAKGIAKVTSKDVCLSKDFVDNLYSGWNNIGTPCDLKETDIKSLFSEVKYIWVWDNKQKVWKFWSKDDNLMDIAKLYVDVIEEIPKFSGIWIRK